MSGHTSWAFQKWCQLVLLSMVWEKSPLQKTNMAMAWTTLVFLNTKYIFKWSTWNHCKVTPMFLDNKKPTPKSQKKKKKKGYSSLVQRTIWSWVFVVSFWWKLRFCFLGTIGEVEVPCRRQFVVKAQKTYVSYPNPFFSVTVSTNLLNLQVKSKGFFLKMEISSNFHGKSYLPIR